MVCLGLEPGAAGWKVQTNPLSYGGTPMINPLGWPLPSLLMAIWPVDKDWNIVPCHYKVLKFGASGQVVSHDRRFESR